MPPIVLVESKIGKVLAGKSNHHEWIKYNSLNIRIFFIRIYEPQNW